MPSENEKGIKGYELNARFGWVGPSGLPADITCRLNSEIARIIACPDTRDTMSAQGIDAATPASPATFGELIADNFTKWVALVRRSGARVD